ncbi:MAG: argininosuccinate synthase [Armatimonadota bacterium]|nr:argininosuccinate synthase [Armatimonadota bacterium]MDW8155216.1 argininosuccinate synthase [Armatimonadota bacterium]
MAKVRKVALAYSGGLDTSVMVPWLRERYGCEVVAVVANVGQLEDFEAVRQKALASGASSCYVVDVRETFARDYIFPALRAGAVYEGRYLLGTALARPLIAKVQVEVALRTGCDALAHGCTGKGNDQVRFELAYQALAPHLRVIAPWREWELRSREDEIAYARRHGIPVSATPEKPYSIDQNLWHTSYEGGVLEDPAAMAPPDMFQLTVDPADAPDVPQYVEVGFESGFPVSLDGARMSPASLIESLNAVAGAHGVGRVDVVENRLVGMKSRGVYETPAGTVLLTALKDLEALTLDRDTLHFKELISPRYAQLVYYGQWYSPLRAALDGFLEVSHRWVTGTVTVKLFKGSCVAVARSSPYSLYRHDLATFGEDAAYDQKDAEGFIHLFGLPTRVFTGVHPEVRDLKVEEQVS